MMESCAEGKFFLVPVQVLLLKSCLELLEGQWRHKVNVCGCANHQVTQGAPPCLTPLSLPFVFNKDTMFQFE